MTEQPTSMIALQDAPITYKTLTAICKTEMVPRDCRNKPDVALAKILMGRELGMGEMTSLHEIDMIQGRPTPSASALTGLIRKAGHRVRPKELTDERATAIAERVEDGEVVESFEFTFTMEMAKRAGLGNKDNWKHYPEAMLWWRAVAQASRIMFPDALLALKYLPEELGETDWSEEPTDSEGEIIEVSEAEVANEDGKILAIEAEEVDTDCPGCGVPEGELHEDDCPELLSPEAVAQALDGEIVVEPAMSTADNTDIDVGEGASDLFGGAEPTVEVTDTDEAWVRIPHLLGADPTAGTIAEILAYLEDLCSAMETVELFPAGSLDRAIKKAGAERLGQGTLRKKDAVQGFSQRIHDFAVSKYTEHNQTEGSTSG